jgi:transposase
MPDKTTAQHLVQARTGRDLEEYLRELYVAKRWTDAEIAALLGVSRSTVRTWRGELGIERSERTAELP